MVTVTQRTQINAPPDPLSDPRGPDAREAVCLDPLVDGHEGHSHVSWRAEFEPEDASQEAALRETFEQIYSEGLEALARRVTGAA